MASLAQSVPKIIRNLKDNSKVSLQCGALTYIRSNAEKLKNTEAVKQEEYREICGLVMETLMSTDQNTRNEATKALRAVLEHFDTHNLKFFETALQANRKKRLKIFRFLETVDDATLLATAQDPSTLNFLNDCLHNVQVTSMEWLLPSACSDNLQALTDAECRTLSDDQELEELTVDCAISLLRRLYEKASVGASSETIRRYDTLVMDKIVTLGYMGHKRQRPPALRLLEAAIGADLETNVKSKYSDAWTRYKNDLQGPYSTRMALLVKACDSDWSSQWSISVRLLGTDLHRGATLINNLLSIEERAFKSTDTNVRRQAFVSWKLLVDNFSLDPKELATARRIKLLCVPLTAKNSKSELIALTKLEVWWYLITKLYPNITLFAEPVITQFLNFCFGPLGDTPLLSTKVDVIASPGKRFYKTKVVAIDALLQLIVLDQRERRALASILEQRLPNPMSERLFHQCYKAFLHSVGEAVVIVDQLNESEIKNRDEIVKVLLTNIMRYVKSTSAELKASVYNELILVLTELQSRVLTTRCVNDFLRDVVVPELATVATELTTSREWIIYDLASIIITPKILKSFRKKHCEPLGNLLFLAVKPRGRFRSDTLEFLGKIINDLETISTDESGFSDCFELWFVCSDIASKYALTENVNEGFTNAPKFKSIGAIIDFPFAHVHSTSSILAQNISITWKDLYKKFERAADAVARVKPNEIFDNTTTMIQESVAKNEKCYRLAVYCLDALLNTINYKVLLEKDETPTIVRLVADLTTIALQEGQPAEADCALKALSSLLITVYGLCPMKALAYLKESSRCIELMLNVDSEEILIKETSSAWETIVSILRGLGSLVDGDFLESWRGIILKATRHKNPEIVAQSNAVIAMKEIVGESAKRVLVELEQEVKKSLKPMSDKASDRAIKHRKVAGSFMNRITSCPRPVFNDKKFTERGKLTPLPPEPDSQDYVVIKSDVKLDVDRLTDHQKESFKRRRDDIPAMYNDLSQSSSQDTQDLQQWFDGKGKQTERTKVTQVENKQTTTVEKTKVEELNEKEPAAAIVIPPVAKETKNLPSERSDPKNSSLSSNDRTKELDESTESVTSDNPSSAKEKFFRDPLTDHSYTGTAIPADIHEPESPSVEENVAMVPKKLNFESRDEYPEDDKSADRELRSKKATNPVIEDSKTQDTSRALKRRKREAGKKNATGSRDEIAEGVQTRGLGKTRGTVAKSGSQPVTKAERGAKRKASSDSESETSERSKRLRGRSSRSPSDTSPEGTVDKRTESEMSRLRIDMVFDGPLPPRRRSKTIKDQPNNENLGKRSSPELKLESKEKRGKTQVDSRANTENNQRRSSRGTDREIAPNQADPLKKRGRRSKQMILQNNSVSQTIVDDDETPTESLVANPTVESTEETAKIVETTEVPSTPQPTEAQSLKDEDEVIESSQDPPGIIGANRKSIISAQNFAKSSDAADEIKVVVDTADRSVRELAVRASSPINPPEEGTKSKPNVTGKSELVDVSKGSHNESDDSDETFLDISAIKSQPVEDAPTVDAEKTDEIKTNGNSTSSKVLEPLFNFSSPKNSSKRFVKPKGFAAQGRAAHMLGLVTKLAVLEKDIEIEKNHADEEATTPTNRRSKFKENETERGKKDRSITFKDNERIASPGGSRQEKIFNNMKAADFAASSPPSKLFANLRNNGEKISPKMEKSDLDPPTVAEKDASSAREDDDHDNDDVNQPNERDDLPILEWSSANPPSLTASPSASILKRNRQIVNEPEVDTTPNKRKRVSFADPPVSKEMGYEVASGSSPMKTTKFNSRSLFGGKNSPLRIKQQSRLKIQISMDQEKASKEEAEESRVPSEVDMDCDSYNALLVRIADDLEDFRSGETSLEGTISDRLTIEVNRDDVTDKDDRVAKAADDIETQDDLFNSSDEKRESPLTNRRLADVSKEQSFNLSGDDNSTLDSLKLNVTDDSILSSITNMASDCENRSECLEDTVDVRNITSLNLSGNSDEMFCEKSARTSCRAPDGVSQMDTLPVSDSIFASLPITQESNSQESTRATLAQPQLLDTIDAIYPPLVDCKVPIESSILVSLANRLWLKNLSKHLQTRGIVTVGDLARLSEREIDRIPVKGNPRLDFVLKVLRKFEEKLSLSSVPKILTVSNSDNDKDTDYLALVPAADNSVDEHSDNYELPILDVSAVVTPTNRETLNDSVSGKSSNPHPRQSIGRTSTTIDSLSGDSSIRSVIGSTATVSQISTIDLVSESILPTTMASVGTSTDTLPKPPSKSVASQISLEELLDVTDVKVVLQNAVKRCSAETLLAQYKLKMGHLSETELAKETMRMLEVETRVPPPEEALKSACRTCGLNKVLVRLPDIFSSEKHFMTKVLTVYRDKLNVTDCLEILNLEDVKTEICRRSSCSEIVEMLSSVSIRDDPEALVTGLKTILRTTPVDVIIDNTVANTDLIPASTVLEIGLKSNDVDVVTSAIESSYPEIARKIVDKTMTPESMITKIESNCIAKDKLLSLFEAISSKLNPQELLDACHAALRPKLSNVRSTSPS